MAVSDRQELPQLVDIPRLGAIIVQKDAPYKGMVMSDKDAFLTGIVQVMREHPDWTPDVFAAVAQGSKEAIKALREECGVSNSAALSALALAETKRLSPKMRGALENSVLNGIAGSTGELEREFIQRVAQLRQGENHD